MYLYPERPKSTIQQREEPILTSLEGFKLYYEELPKNKGWKRKRPVRKP